jgi:beta-lactamase class A
VKRSVFLGAGAAATLAAAAPACADTLRYEIERAAAYSTGVLGAYARRLGKPVACAYNADEVFPAASVIKLLILVTLYQEAERDPALLQQRVRLRASDFVGGSDYLQNAEPGEWYAVETLARAMIDQSDNTASNTLITLFGFARINRTAERAGLYHTQLKRHFLDYTAIVHHSENLTSARDIGVLMYQLERGAHEAVHTIARPASCRKMIDILLHQEDRDKIVRGLPKGTPVANKTGEINAVRNDAAIVDPYGESPYILTVLTKDLADFSNGVIAIRRVAKAVNTAFAGT